MLRSLYRLYRFIRLGAPRFLIVNELKILSRKAMSLKIA